MSTPKFGRYIGIDYSGYSVMSCLNLALTSVGVSTGQGLPNLVHRPCLLSGKQAPLPRRHCNLAPVHKFPDSNRRRERSCLHHVFNCSRGDVQTFAKAGLV